MVTTPLSRSEAPVGRTAAVAGRINASGVMTLRVATLVLALITGFLVVDAIVQPVAPFDVWVMNTVQSVEFAGLATVLTGLSHLTSTIGAVTMWFVMLIAFSVSRKWLPALAMLALPIGGLVNNVVGEYLVGRTRPDDTEYSLTRTIADIDAPSFPSGHVMGAVMLYGLLFFVAMGWHNRIAALAVQTASVAVIAVTGVARIWEGAHWPSDVLGAYALGGLMLIGIIAAYRRIDLAVGDIPFVKAALVPHDESRPHAHALTSTVFFNEDSVAKVYAPGFVPRALYWLSYQAEFPYIGNIAALQAARERRNLAAMLTEYWYGERRVALVTGIDNVDGRHALSSEFIDGGEPADRRSAKRFLRDLRSKFEDAGLPTWQIDPRQPRAVDNLIEAPNGYYFIVDLESGLVSPLASVRTWWRAIRRGMVPLFDDVYFDVTRDYLEREARSMRMQMGEAWVTELGSQIDRAEAETLVWHASEPRIWSRILRGFWTGFGIRTWRSRMRARVAGGQAKATEWMLDAVDSWQSDNRITGQDAEALRTQMAEPTFQAILPHLGGHLIISVILRFPFGSVARSAWTAWGLFSATGRLLTRRIDRRAWKQAWDIHHPIVIALAAIPGFGTFAYLAARPVRSNRMLVRVAIDAVMLKIPARLYERSGLRRLIARRAGSVTEASVQDAVAEPPTVAEGVPAAVPAVVSARAPSYFIGRYVSPWRPMSGTDGSAQPCYKWDS